MDTRPHIDVRLDPTTGEIRHVYYTNPESTQTVELLAERALIESAVGNRTKVTLTLVGKVTVLADTPLGSARLGLAATGSARHGQDSSATIAARR